MRDLRKSKARGPATDSATPPVSEQGPTPGAAPGREGTCRLRVRYSECDPMNVAHHAAYIPWLEIGRTELLRASGLSYARLEHDGIYLVVAKLECRYRRPVLYDDIVEIRTRWSGGGRVKIEHEYEVTVVERDGKECRESALAASTTLACVDKHGKIRELPEWLQATE